MMREFHQIAILILAVICCGLVDAAAQGTGGGSGDGDYGIPAPGAATQQGSAATEMIAGAAESFPTDNVVDPEEYIIGPGDVLMLQLVGTISGDYPLQVSPEGTIMLPRLGQIAMPERTLAEVRDTVVALYRERNANWGVAILLMRARTVWVHIHGNVKYPRMYALPASMRISTAVAYANQEPAQSFNPRLKGGARSLSDRVQAAMDVDLGSRYICRWERRNTVVYHKDGSSNISDDMRARLLDRASEDPTLREGDEIFVPYQPIEAPMISITGAVRRPITMPYRRGDSLSLLLRAGYGLADHADPDAVYYLAPGATSREKIDVEAVLAGPADRAITAGASIVVEREPRSDMRISTASVNGMVENAGTYVITPGQTRLSDLVAMSGGTTDEAYLPLAYILRRDLMAAEGNQPDELLMRLTQFYTLGLGDTARFRLHNTLRNSTVACDVGAALERGSKDDDVLIQNGDVLVIPENPKNVYVYGHVVNPGYVNFEQGRSAEWYLQRAGGAAESADMARAAVIKGRTSIWIEDDLEDIRVESGDIVYIPADPQFAPGVEAQEYAFYVNLVSAGVVVLTTLINLLSN